MSDTYRHLGEIAKIQTGFAFASTLFQEDGIPLIRMSSLKNGQIKTESGKFIHSDYASSYSSFLLRENDLLIGMSGSLSNFAIVKQKDVPAFLNQRVARLLLSEHETNADYKYLTYCMTSDDYFHYADWIAEGAAQKNISSRQIEGFKFYLPSIQQQKKIAKILSTVDNLIEKTQTLIDKYTAIKQGMMADLFTRGIDMTTGDTPNSKGGKLRPSVEDAPELYKQTELGWVPKKWEVKRLGDISTVSSGITLGNEYSGSDAVEVPYLRVANVQDGYLDLSEVKTVKIPPTHVAKYLLEVGDVLMNEGGDFDKLGRGTIWNGEVEGCCHQNHVFKVRAHRSQLFSEYLAYWSASSFGKSYFIMNSKQSTNLASINSSQLKRFPVLVPSIEEQQVILEKLSAVDGNISKLKLDVDKNKRVKKGLMQDLLTGKVKVQ
jgi:type I restriction enzyme S subunit